MDYKEKALFLDLDGTVRQPISDSKFITSPDDQQIIPGVKEAIQYFADLDYVILGLTNQAGVAFGYKTLKDCFDEQLRTLELCPAIDEIMFCPDMEGKTLGQVNKYSFNDYKTLSNQQLDDVVYGEIRELTDSHKFNSFRKPDTGMLEFSIFSHYVGLSVSLMVGDMQSDRDLVKDTSCGFLWAEQWRELFGTR